MPPRKRRTVKVEYEAEPDNVATGQGASTTARGRRARNLQSYENNGPEGVVGIVAENSAGTVDEDPSLVVQPSSPVKGKRGKKVSKVETESKQPIFEPADWETVLANIKEMRKNKNAPVDNMGCERTMEEKVDPKVRRFQTLLSLMLSSQTKDPVTYAAMERLKAGTPLTVQKILDMSEEELGKTIIPVGFWRRKASYIKKASQILREKYEDDIPKTVEELCSLPGVGPKMAYIAMHVAWEKNVGIGVDTHVHRISNRLGWTGPKETKTPEDTRKALQLWLPPDQWQEFNILLVGFGQTICLPIGPKCDICLNNQLCPYGKSNVKKNMKKKKKTAKKPQTEDISTTDTSAAEDDDGEVSEYFK